MKRWLLADSFWEVLNRTICYATSHYSRLMLETDLLALWATFLILAIFWCQAYRGYLEALSFLRHSAQYWLTIVKLIVHRSDGEQMYPNLPLELWGRLQPESTEWQNSDNAFLYCTSITKQLIWPEDVYYTSSRFDIHLFFPKVTSRVHGRNDTKFLSCNQQLYFIILIILTTFFSKYQCLLSFKNTKGKVLKKKKINLNFFILHLKLLKNESHKNWPD